MRNGMLRAALVLLVLASAPAASSEGLARATFAGGCFWCVEADFDKVPGVVSTTSGYTGGHARNPTYEQVVSGRTGHTEAVLIVYDPKKVSYERLLEVFWRNIDPTTPNAQFCDVGSQYRSAIFYHNEEQRQAAEASKRKLEMDKPFKAPIVTEILPTKDFHVAEDYHQDYYRKNPVRYSFYRTGCGRDARLKELWGEPPATK
jgi:peptide-methionine (S)-S-oxide reductase